MAVAAQQLERISAEARKLQFSRALLTLAIAPFYALGWVLAKVWLTIAWAITAVRIGWTEAHGK